MSNAPGRDGCEKEIRAHMCDAHVSCFNSTRFLISMGFPINKSFSLQTRQAVRAFTSRLSLARPHSSHLLFPPVLLFLVAPFCSKMLKCFFFALKWERKIYLYWNTKVEEKPVFHSDCVCLLPDVRADTLPKAAQALQFVRSGLESSREIFMS